jgi:uncharacterized repeat protein (TIGR03803 family)
MVRLRQLFSLGFVLAFSGCSTFSSEGISDGAPPPPAKITRASASGTFTTLYSFQGRPDGANPQGSVDAFTSCTARCTTTIYGNTSSGGTNDAGTIYLLSSANGPGYSEKVLLSYTPSADGSDPTGAIVARGIGTLFGTASQGGVDGKGTVIELDGGKQVAQLSFDGHNGASPYAGLVFPGGRNLYYATTFAGGRHNRGALVSIKATHQKLVPKVLYSFSGKSDGEHPNSVLTTTVFCCSPYYGTTAGSKSASGTVYAFAPGHGLTTLYTFKDSSDGVTPTGVYPTDYATSAIFGTTLKGGSSGYGTLYELIPNGSAYTKTTLHTFTGGSGDGAFPQGPLVRLPPALYGVTKSGGSEGCGTIFSVDMYSGEYSSLYSFTCGDGGAYPEAPIRTSLSFYGNFLYGTTSAGGTANKGTVFSYKL